VAGEAERVAHIMRGVMDRFYMREAGAPNDEQAKERGAANLDEPRRGG